MGSRALLLIPPFLKYSAGPLLGPALLQSAARSRGHTCDVIDLNAHYLKPRVSRRMAFGKFVGDHDKPVGPRSLSQVEDDFMDRYILPGLNGFHSLSSSSSSSLSSSQIGGKEEAQSLVDNKRKVTFGFLTHAQVRETGQAMALQDFGKWTKDVLEKNIALAPPPDIVGVSLLHSGQVIPATAVSTVVKQLWPQSLLVWGGPHISGLGRETLERDLSERSFAADVFVTGHAEETFVQILEQVSGLKQASKQKPVVLAGKSSVIAPTFENLDMYDAPLTLPAQSTLGCAYGRCAFCTYPSIEDTPKKLDISSTVGTVVDRAEALGASVSLKDSLVTATRLTEIGGCIQGRVKWSACTKLSSRLDFKRLSQLRADGLATLEVGLESLLPETQKRIDKIQPKSLYEEFVSDVANLPGLSLVVNYMIGFPWEDSNEANSKLDEAKDILVDRLGIERGCIELNEFELERMAVMAKFPEAYGIDPRRIRSWPWASVLEVRDV